MLQFRGSLGLSNFLASNVGASDINHAQDTRPLLARLADPGFKPMAVLKQ